MTAVTTTPLQGGSQFEGMHVQLLSDDEIASIEGGAIWAGVGALLAAGALACVIGVVVGVGIYYLLN